MSIDEVRNKIISILQSKVENPNISISGQSDIRNDLITDSLDIMSFILEAEDEFDISIPMEDVERFKTVDDAAQYIKKQLD